MLPDVAFTSKAAALLLKMRAEHPALMLLLDDTSCCANSNVMARESRPSWPVDLLSDRDGVQVCINPVLRKSLKSTQIIIDVIDFADDSLSLETDYGKRFTMYAIS
jgi:uncharacterized protein (DUF779 family)